MVAAEQNEIAHLRFAAVGPVNDVMGIDVFVGATAWKAAALVATLQRAPNRRRDASGLSADVQCRSILARILVCARQEAWWLILEGIES